jgi:RNA ligase (TIGR02306 family)
MSSFKVEVVPVQLEKHENADTLSIAKVYGWNCVVRTDDFKNATLGAYIPLDSIVPDQPEWGFLKGHRRIRTSKLRGIISQGLLVPARPHWKLGDNVAEELGIVKYEQSEPPISLGQNDDQVSAPSTFYKYTDIENWKNYPNIINDGEDVVVTEKLHGSNWRAAILDDVFYVGTHRTARKYNPDNIYWKVAIKYDIEKKLRAAFPSDNGAFILYGEVFGRVQDLRYGLNNDVDLRIFDVFSGGRYYDYEYLLRLCDELSLPTVPILYHGPFNNDVLKLANGQAFQGGHIREGVVVKPVIERWDKEVGRVILKCISDDYLLRKKGTEYH